MLDKLKFLWSKTNRWHRVLVLFLVVELQVIPGGHLGFQCKDPALSFPYTGDTISWKWLISMTALLPLVVMLIVERKYHAVDKERPKNRPLRWYREYLYGFCLNLTIVHIFKLAVGSPRPHFFDTCSPKEAFTCEESNYITSYTCTKSYWINQSDRSFPSGHTSLGIHAGVFIVYYLYRRTKNAHTNVIRAVQLLCMAASVYCAISRMTDHRHHWWDVLAGAVIAAVILPYTISSCKSFECSDTKRKVDTQEKNSSVTYNGTSNAKVDITGHSDVRVHSKGSLIET